MEPRADEPEASESAAVWTVDDLAAATGMTVRTVRYYVTCGLVPAPERRGRMSYFTDADRARLQYIGSMQEQGLSLAAIEQHLAYLPADCSAGEIEIRNALIASWSPPPRLAMNRSELEANLGRRLNSKELTTLEKLGAVRRTADGFEARATFAISSDLLDLDIPMAALQAAGETIQVRMDELVLELREILRSEILGPLRQSAPVPDAADFRLSMTRLRQLTLASIVGRFQDATEGLVDGSLLVSADDSDGSRPARSALARIGEVRRGRRAQ